MSDRPRAARLMHPRGAAGFTLIEIMVVIVIIGILVTFVSLSIGNRALDDRMEAEARRLEKLMQLAADEAQIQGMELGFRHTEQGYEFLGIGTEGKWTTLAEVGSLRPREITEPFYLELRVEGRLIKPALPEEPGEDEDDKDDTGTAPQVLLLSSGEMSAFTLDLKARHYASYFRLEGDALGKLKLERLQEKS